MPFLPGQSSGNSLEAAIAAEKVRNARLVNLFRLAGATAFVLLELVLDVLDIGPRTISFASLYMVYGVFSAAVFLGGKHNGRFARMSSLVIPLVDVPSIYLLQHYRLMQSTNPMAAADFTLSFVLSFCVLAALSLERWHIISTGVMGGILQLNLQEMAGESVLAKAAGFLLIILVVGVLEYGRTRRIHMIRRVIQEQRRRERLCRYFSPQVAASIEDDVEDLAAGRLYEVSILFADIRGFTAISEKLASDRLITLLNEFHGRMVDVVFSLGGTLDKYIGDGLMVYFGAPVPQEDHALRAIRCAINMQGCLSDLNFHRIDRGEPPLRMGIGIHTGPAVVGSIGAAHRREFTVIGDTVNVAARLEELTKVFHVAIVVSEATRRKVEAGFPFTNLKTATLRGRKIPIHLYALDPVRTG